MAALMLLFTLLSLVVVTRQRARIARLEADNARMRTTINMLVQQEWQRQWQRPPHWQDHRRFVAAEPVGDWRVR